MTAKEFLCTEDYVLEKGEQSYIITQDDFEEMLTSFAKQKAWEAWKDARTKYTLLKYKASNIAIRLVFEKWWEDSK